MTNNNHLDHWSIAPLISSWLIMYQQPFRNCFRWSMFLMFLWYIMCWESSQIEYYTVELETQQSFCWHSSIFQIAKLLFTIYFQ